MSLKAKRKLQKHLDTDTAVWTGFGLIQSADQQAASFFRVMMSLTVRLFSFGTLCLEHLKSPGLSPRPLCCFLHTVQDLAMLCRFADDTVSSNKKGRWRLLRSEGWRPGCLWEPAFSEVVQAGSE